MKKICYFIVLTGGPGAGKTAVLELAKKKFEGQLWTVQESANIIFSGGFPRLATLSGKKAAQRAVFYVQRELENLAGEEATIALCDRGSLDGLAYWPETTESFFRELGLSREEEFKRYSSIIHLRCPTEGHGYNHQNPVRVEPAEEAHLIDQKIELAWRGHPRRFFIENNREFMAKAEETLHLISLEIQRLLQK